MNWKRYSLIQTITMVVVLVVSTTQAAAQSKPAGPYRPAYSVTAKKPLPSVPTTAKPIALPVGNVVHHHRTIRRIISTTVVTAAPRLIQQPSVCSAATTPTGAVRDAVDSAIAKFGLEDQRCRVYRIGFCESGWNPMASNGSHHGLFQQAVRYWPERVGSYNAQVTPAVSTSDYDAASNAAVSVRMMAAGGWSNWVCK